MIHPPGAGGPAEPDPDELLLQLRRAAGEPPLPPLRLADPTPSARRGPSGGLVGTARRTVLRLIAPALADLLVQLERDRARARAELDALRKRVEELERARTTR
ncbi:MAG: hypothetical protein QOD86_26 [Miltoncostaeaceae bacterium]|nr:hypothetical protein [Miltoncostaeaceae bacterium]